MLTVLLATRNGSRTLPDVLANFTRLQVHPSDRKLVMADNGSTDSSREIIATFQVQLPLTCVFEEKSGKNAGPQRWS